MPEGAENKYTADILRDNLLNLYITQIDYSGREGKNMSFIDRDLLESHLPLSIDSIESRGKRIIFVMNNKHMFSSAFVFFFAMTGYIRFTESKHDQMSITLSRKRKNGTFKEKKTIFYGDKRLLGFIKFATTGEEIIDIFKAIGPDFFHNEVTLDMFTNIVKNKRIKKKQIAALLLEQNKASGLGSYLRCEILYLACISPYRELEDLSEKDIKRLYKSILIICDLSYKGKGLTIGDFFSPFGEKGEYDPMIYGKLEDPDENKVIHEKFGKPPSPGKKDLRRSIWWVKEVQI